MASLGTAATADAAEYSIKSCSTAAADFAGGSSIGWESESSLQGIVAAGTCPAGLGFDYFDIVAGARASWDFWKQSLPVSAIAMKVTGVAPSGIDLALYACAEVANNPDRTRDRSSCARVAPLPVPGAGATANFSAALPLGALPEIRATCIAATCPAGTGYRFNDVVITVDDTTPPKTSVYGLVPGGGSTYWGGWNRADSVGGEIYAKDPTGMSTASAWIDDEPPFWRSWTSGGYCSMNTQPGMFFSWALPCSDTIGWGGAIYVRDLVDGWHTLKVIGTDAVGNTKPAPDEYPFAIDGTAPVTPDDLRVVGVTPNSWTTLDQVDLTWRNPGEDAPTSTQSGVVTGWYDIDPEASTPPGLNPGPVDPYWIGSSRNMMKGIVLPGDGLWRIYVGVTDKVGNASGRARVTVGRDVDDPPSPQPNGHGWLRRVHLIDGAIEQSWAVPPAPTLESGVCGFATSFNASPQSEPAAAVDVPAPAVSTAIPAGLPDGRNYFHIRAISCAGRASPTATTPVDVDGVPPSVHVTGEPAGQWSSAPVELTMGATDDHSGVASVKYFDNGWATEATGDSVSATLGEGTHELMVRARDTAGNDSADLYRVVRVDTIPPAAWFEPSDVTKPRTLRARVTDALSGVLRATIEYRRDGVSEAWRELPATTRAADLSRGELTLEAEIPDVQLPEGDFEFRVTAVDVAGNAVASGLDLGGSPVRKRLPLRRATWLTAGVALMARCRSAKGRAKKSRPCKLAPTVDRASARSARLVDFGEQVALVGQLVDEHANTLAGREVRVYRSPRGGGTMLLATTRTDASGFYEMRLPAGPTSKLIARSPGSDSELPAVASADVVVRSGLTLSVSDRSVHFGDTLRFRGRLRTIGNANPAGRIVEFQYFNGRSWQFAIGAPKTGVDGRFSTEYRFTKVRRPTTYKFRVAIKSQDGWPFESGASRSVRVRVTD